MYKSSLRDLAIVVLLAPGVVVAQVDTGAVLGTVKDSGGGVIAGALITLTSTATSFSTTTHTKPDGTYIFTPVKVGPYSVTAEAPGFERLKHNNVEVVIQQ